jgi:hypothetical protein
LVGRAIAPPIEVQAKVRTIHIISK